MKDKKQQLGVRGGKIIIGNCPQCNKELQYYEKHPKKFCSRECKDDSRRVDPAAKRAKYDLWYENNIDHLKQYAREYDKKNKERRQAKSRERWPEVYKRARLRRALRSWVHRSVKYNKGDHDTDWYTNVGCTRDEFKAHIESQFVEGMSWDNWTRDGWHMDHIIPLSKGGTNHYTNLQPLWAKDNMSKSNKL